MRFKSMKMINTELISQRNMTSFVLSVTKGKNYLPNHCNDSSEHLKKVSLKQKFPPFDRRELAEFSFKGLKEMILIFD